LHRLKSLGSLLCCLLLGACGGGGVDNAAATPRTSATIGGTLTGFPGGTLLLGNSGVEAIAVTANGSFSFSKPVGENNPYAVTVLGQPSGTECTVTNGTGTVAHNVAAVSNVSITCSDVAFAFIRFNVGVTVSGLATGNSVTLMNNGNETVTASENGLFVFPVAYVTAAVYSGRGGGYEVTVKSGPANQTCSVTGGSGAVTAPVRSNFINVVVLCN
jgi:hypothetical protein